MGFTDGHVHVWTPDTGHYPLAAGYKKEDMKPASFTPEELFKHIKPAGVDRVNLIQMSYYGFEKHLTIELIIPTMLVAEARRSPGATGHVQDTFPTRLLLHPLLARQAG
jgi:predicted TIM-barrel fold metal-dependent hydrolase